MTVQSLPTKVANGDTAAFLVTISNGHRGNISRLFLSAVTPPGATYLTATPQTGTCKAWGPLSCTLGSLGKGRSVTVLAIYRAPATGTTLKVKFEATTSGASDRDRHATSHGDKLEKLGVTALASNSNFAGRFVLRENQLDVFNDQRIGNQNQHATKVRAPTTGIPVTVEDTNSAAGCPASLGCFGKASEIHVAGGKVFAGGFLVTVTFGPGELPQVAASGSRGYAASYPEHGSDPFTAADLHIWHQRDNLSGADVPRCDEDEHHRAASFASDRPDPHDLPCFMAKDRHDGGIVAFIWLKVNGNIKGY